MNFLQKQLVLDDGRTLAERHNAGEQLGEPCIADVELAPAPQQVTVEEFLRGAAGEREGGAAMAWEDDPRVEASIEAAWYGGDLAASPGRVKMTEEERRDVDRAALELLGWTELEWVSPKVDWQHGYWKGQKGVSRRETGSPSSDPPFVVPLAEALERTGKERTGDDWGVEMRRTQGAWYVVLLRNEERIVSCIKPALPEALAIIAWEAEKEFERLCAAFARSARAVGAGLEPG